MSHPENPPNAMPNYPPDPGKKSNRNSILLVLLGGCGCMGLAVFVLSTILSPLLAQDTSQARMTSCLSNEKQMGVAFAQYIQDYDETYPPSKNWMATTRTYFKYDTVNHCPAASSYGEDRMSVFGYAYNSKMIKRTVAEISNVAIAPLIYDSATLTENASDPVTSLPVPPRHSLSNVMSFADGHARSFTSAALQALLNDPAQKSLFGK